MSRKVQDLEDELKKMQLEREQLEVAYLDLQEKCRPFEVCVCPRQLHCLFSKHCLLWMYCLALLSYSHVYNVHVHAIC